MARLAQKKAFLPQRTELIGQVGEGIEPSSTLKRVNPLFKSHHSEFPLITINFGN
jgi:hypothetical protein